MTTGEWIALGMLFCNIILTSLSLWRNCQSVKKLDELRKQHHDRRNGNIVPLVVPFMLLVMLVPAFAHDSWISRGGHRNAAGEWCCGEGDCFQVEPVRTTANGYLIMATGELVPFAGAAVAGWRILALQAAGWLTTLLLRAATDT